MFDPLVSHANEARANPPEDIPTPDAALALVRLDLLMRMTAGVAEVAVAMIDGPVALEHPDLDPANIRLVPSGADDLCTQLESVAFVHGTYIAGILHGRRRGPAPALCPGCTLLVRPIFPGAASRTRPDAIPAARPQDLAAAILDVIGRGARIVNLSVSVAGGGLRREPELEEVLHHAAQRGVIIVAAAGNEGRLGGSAITRHPGVISVIAYDAAGRALGFSNLGNAIGRHGLGAPGDRIASLGASGNRFVASGTSVAAPFVTGTAALLWSLFPTVGAQDLKMALLGKDRHPRSSVTPPLLDAWAAYEALRKRSRGDRQVARDYTLNSASGPWRA